MFTKNEIYVVIIFIIFVYKHGITIFGTIPEVYIYRGFHAKMAQVDFAYNPRYILAKFTSSENCNFLGITGGSRVPSHSKKGAP